MKKVGMVMGVIALSVTVLAGCGIETESTSASKSETYTLEGDFTSSQEIVDDIYFSGFVDDDTIILSEDQIKEIKQAYFTVEKGSRFTFYSHWHHESVEFEVLDMNPKTNSISLKGTFEK